MARIEHRPPALLEARVLNESERQRLIGACEQEFAYSGSVKGILEIVWQFVNFCALLSRTENHILVRSGQYTVKEVPARLEHDVVNQKARELMELPQYTAYAKILQETDGKESVWKGKLKTLKLGPEDFLSWALVKARWKDIDTQSADYLKRRDHIAEEITRRRERWRAKVVEEPPAAQSAGKTEAVKAPAAQEPRRLGSSLMEDTTQRVSKPRAAAPEDEPPPSHS